MVKKIVELSESLYVTIISGIFLLVALFSDLCNLKIIDYFNPAIISVLLSGLPIIYSAINKLIKNSGIKKISSSLLITIAIISSVIIGDIFAAGEVAFIMAIGELLEDKTTAKAKKGLKKLISLTPATVRKIHADKEETVPSHTVQIGDVIRILPGETVAVDGVIIDGETTVDQSVITGESLPIDKTLGDKVFSGSINGFGCIDVKATSVVSDSTLNKLIRLVKNAELKKAPIQTTLDKLASILVPVALFLAILFGVIKNDIVIAVTVLVVFCPCALVLATPTAIMAAIGNAAKKGIIIKNGESLEKLSKVKAFVFDKTGTLTYGKPEVSDIVVFDKKFTKDSLFTLLYSVEQKSEHPLAKAIVKRGEELKLTPLKTDGFKMYSGQGVSSMLGGNKVYCGNEKFIEQKSAQLSDEVKETLNNFKNKGKSVIIIAISDLVIGAVSLSDTLKPEAQTTLHKLAALGFETFLLSGDNEKSVQNAVSFLNFTCVKSNLLPEEKVTQITELQKNSKSVCMVGDGINDAPALKSADVSIAMGTIGSDTTLDAADIALTGDDISKIPYLVRLSNKTVSTIKLGIFLSLFINFLAVILSFFNLLTPVLGALIHNFGSIFVILLSALLYERKI